MKIQEPEGEPKAPSWTTETKKDHIKRVRGMVSLLPLLWPAQYHMERVLGPQFLFWDIQLPQYYGTHPRRPIQVSPDRNHGGGGERGDLQGLTAGDQIETEKE